MSFEREERYIVFKLSDFKDPLILERLKELALIRDALRGTQGKSPLVCAVVERDWPEYEVVWEMIQERVEAEEAARIHTAMVEENSRIADQSDKAYEAIREASLTDGKLIDPTILTMIADMNGEIEG